MGVRKITEIIAIRREAAMVRTLLEELEQLTGHEAENVTQQLADHLGDLARRLVDAAAAIMAMQSPPSVRSAVGEPPSVAAVVSAVRLR